MVSPTHKRTEGRAPVWGSEFTSKGATLQGGSSRNRSYAERKVMDFGCDWSRAAAFCPIIFLNQFEPSRTI